MKISERQLQLLMIVLQDSVGIEWSGFTLHTKIRIDLFQDIVNQQSREIKEVE